MSWATFITMEPKEIGMAIFKSRTMSTLVRIGFGEYFRSSFVMSSPLILWRMRRKAVPTKVLSVTPKMAPADATGMMAARAWASLATTLPKTAPPASNCAIPTFKAIIERARPKISLATTSTIWETAVGVILRSPS